MRTKGQFGRQQPATKQFVYETLERTPLGIVIESEPHFENVGMVSKKFSQYVI